jgi:hypothetical protein
MYNHCTKPEVPNNCTDEEKSLLGCKVAQFGERKVSETLGRNSKNKR